MNACEFPGCVGEAGDNGRCPVHVHQKNGGKPCERCRGTGYVQHYTGFDMKSMVRDLCEQCAGVGLRDAKRSKVTPKAEVIPVDERGLIQIAEPDQPKDDAYAVAVREALRR
jgi:DnaJ-class molecular chaperone